jgi:hypothetical protein
MPRHRPTILVTRADTCHKIVKVWFGADGSYYVTVPYHKARTAVLTKLTAQYDTPFGQTVLTRESQMIEVASLEDEGRLKLSHHPDGFCQFSGDGVLSGKDEEGRIRGIGIQSRALPSIGPKFGPIFIVLAYGIEDFDPTENPKQHDLVVRYDMLAPAARAVLPCRAAGNEPAPGVPDKEGICVEAFYFQPSMRRFIMPTQVGRMIYMPHPTGIVIPLTVILADEDCEHPGFLGLYASRQMVRFPSDSGFSITGPAENYREDSHGRRLGDIISCHYPRPEGLVARRSVDYPQKAEGSGSNC